jgi:uncharacterized protein related to proFAR isomerase
LFASAALVVAGDDGRRWANVSGAVDVVRGLLAVYPFPTPYVAALDAIQRNGDNFPPLRRIRAEFPELRLWVDNGAADGFALIGPDLGAPVIGSESQRDSALIARYRDSRRILALALFSRRSVSGRGGDSG